MARWVKYICITLLAAVGTAEAGAQSFSKVDLPERICSGDTVLFSYGFNPLFDVVVVNMRSTLSHPGKVFLPDGEPCGENGCSYRSPVTFTDFSPGAAIATAHDIKYVRLNMEHSFIGDLYINITCPSGQKADLMRFGGNNDSGCSGAIPIGSSTWLAGSNMGQGNYFGVPVDQENTNALCDSTAPGNQPGTGWNYCWSNNTTSGYSYASGDGIIYRSGHAHNGSVDSSNSALGLNFYHPDDNFNALIGCPLNGSWYIEVVDGYSQANGYIFEWEMSLDESLLPTPCQVVEKLVMSEFVEYINDSTYRLALPPREEDTTIAVWLAIVSTCGDTIDTTVNIVVGHSVYSETRDTVIENNLPVVWQGIAFTDDVDTVISHPTAMGCDSALIFHLKVWHNVAERHDTTICINKMPAYWRGVLWSDAGDTTLYFKTVHGADSTVTLTLTTAPTYDIALTDSTCSNYAYFIGSHLCDSTGHYEYKLASEWGCDSMVRVDLTVMPAYDVVIFDTACASVGYEFDGVTYIESGTYVIRKLTTEGCDSITTLNLAIKGADMKARAEIVPHIVTVQNPTVRLRDVSSGADGRLWEVDGGTSDSELWIIAYPVDKDSVPVTLIATTRAGCNDTVREMLYLDRATLFTPNVFTPDKESNNRWQPAMYDIVKLEVSIYDRQGRLIYSYEGVDGYWDGTHNGKPCQQGAYVFTARYVSRLYPGRVQTMNGTITLLR